MLTLTIAMNAIIIQMFHFSAERQAMSPVNFAQIQLQIREMGQLAPRVARERLERVELARRCLAELAEELDALRSRVAQVVQHVPTLRCAVPLDQPLTAHLPPAPQLPLHSLLAADGSQINPNAHDPEPFGVINVGVFIMRPGLGDAPREVVRSRLLCQEALYNRRGHLLSEEVVALRRDLSERQELLELARNQPAPVLTLTDGPLELFREPREDEDFRQPFADYLHVLQELAEAGVMTAGYVDKPRADLVVRLLELTLLPQDALSRAGVDRPLRGVGDTDLFWPLLAPGERTAVFAIQSGLSNRFTDRLALHFFYLNVGSAAHPWLARVEIPAWMAVQPQLLDLLQAALLWQCRQMGGRPYPYALQRAHEVAVVRLEEKQQLEEMILAELRRQGLMVGERSHKQSGKDLLSKRHR